MSSQKQVIEVDSQDVIKLILQFCKESNLTNTFKTLQNETKVNFNSLSSLSTLTSNILNGKWDQVLKTLRNLDIPILTVMKLYEQIVYELVENKDNDIADILIKDNTDTINKLRTEFPERFSNLETIVKNKSVNINDLYNQFKTTKDKNRAILNDLLLKEVCITQPSRLLFLLGEALKNINRIDNLNGSYNIFTGKLNHDNFMESTGIEQNVSKIDKKITFGEKSYIEAARFSPDGYYLATGSIDGFIEIWDPVSGKLKSDLTYQLDNNILVHLDSVLTLNFSRDSKMLCSADASGNIKIWKVLNGKCLREFTGAHSKGITCISFNKDNSLVISGSFDSNIRVFGLKSGKQINELSGHNSFINDLCIVNEGDKLISASADSYIKVWDIKNYELLNTISLPTISFVKEIGINNISLYPKNNDYFFVSNKSLNIYLLNIQGEIIKTFNPQNKKNFVYCLASPLGEYLYSVDEDNIVYVIQVSTNKLISNFKIHDRDIIGLAHHPSKNILVSFSLDGFLNIIK